MAPTLKSAAVEEWIALDNSLLNLRLLFIAYLHPFASLDQSAYLNGGQSLVGFCDSSQICQLVVTDVALVLLGKQELVDPILSTMHPKPSIPAALLNRNQDQIRRDSLPFELPVSETGGLERN